MDEILTLGEAASYLRLAPITLYRKARRGEIPAAKVGKSWRFHRDQLAEWLKHLATDRPLSPSLPDPFRHLSTRESQAVLQFIESFKDRYDSKLKKIILYGSRSRGDFKDHSDIDLLLVLKIVDKKTTEEIQAFTNQFSLQEDILLQTFVISSEEQSHPSFRTFLLMERINREGIPLYG